MSRYDAFSSALGAGMQRREFIRLIGGAAAWPVAARAQPRGKIPVVGTIWHAGSEKEEDPWFGYQRQAFADLGYIPGKSIIFEDRYAAEIPERFDVAAAELVRLNVDVIISNVLLSTRAAIKATSTIPVIFMVADPVRLGVVPSFAHPGGNATGLSYMSFDLDGKRLQLFKDAVPTLSRVALLLSAVKFQAERDTEEYMAAAKQHDIGIETFQARGPDEFKAAFSKMARSHFDGLIVGTNQLIDINAQYFYELALNAGLPTMGSTPVHSERGALLSYGPPFQHLYRDVAVLTKRILGGEKPADLPVQQPTRIELALNMKTAKALGLTLPPQFLARVERVIE